MPHIPGGNTKNAEGAQGLTASGPTNVFPFTDTPADPNLYDGYDLELTTGEGLLADRPGFGETKLKSHALPHPLA